MCFLDGNVGVVIQGLWLKSAGKDIYETFENEA